MERNGKEPLRFSGRFSQVLRLWPPFVPLTLFHDAIHQELMSNISSFLMCLHLGDMCFAKNT